MGKIKQYIYNLLRKSEAFFKLDMIYVAKGGFWITFGQAISSVVSLLVVIAFANLLPKETYGIYRYILSLAGILNVFSLLGMNNAVARAVSANQEGVLKQSVNYQLKWNMMMLAAFIILSSYYFYEGNELMAFSFLILGAFVPPTLALNTYGAFLTGKKEFKLVNIANILSTIVYAIGIFLAIILSGDIFWIVFAYAITTFVPTLLFYIYVLLKFKPKGEMSKETLKYGRELTFIGFIEPIASQIDKILLAHFWGVAELAVYSLALAIPNRVTSFVKGWVGLGYPKLSIKNPDQINETFYRRLLQGAGVGALIAVAYIIAAPYVFKYLLPQYMDSLFYSQILSISFIFAMPNRFLSLVFLSQKFSKIILTTDAIQTIIKLILYAIFGIWVGILGLIIAYVLFSFIGLMINIGIWKWRTS